MANFRLSQKSDVLRLLFASSILVILEQTLGFLGWVYPFVVFFPFVFWVVIFTLLFLARKLLRNAVVYIGFVVLMGAFIYAGIFWKGFSSQEAKPDSLEVLRSLSYLDSVPILDEEDMDKEGVTTYEEDWAWKGINLFALRSFREAYLMNMKGQILHAWTMPSEHTGYHHVKMTSGGDLLAILYDERLIRMDWDSNLKWSKDIRAHHEIAISQDGDIYVWQAKEEIVFWWGLPLPIRNDYVVILSPQGEIKRQIGIHKLLKDRIPVQFMLNIYRELLNPQLTWGFVIGKGIGRFRFQDESPFDVFHANTITVLDRDVEGLSHQGDLLISVRELDLIGIVDLKSEKLIWSWGPGNLSRQHQPVLLNNGNVLIYDNGFERDYSRIIELEPLKKEIVWEYKGRPPSRFYCPKGGGSQRLPNGNTLVTEEYYGHVFEVTPDRKMVWEYYTPKTTDNERAAVYRMTRFTHPDDYPKLRDL